MQITDYSIATDPLLNETIYYPANLSILSTQLKFCVFSSYGTFHKNMKYIVLTLPNGNSRIRFGSTNTDVIDMMYNSFPWPEKVMEDDHGNTFKYKIAPSPQEMNEYIDRFAEEYSELL